MNQAPRSFSPRDDQSPPIHAKTFTSADYGGAQVLLNAQSSGPPRHAACALFVVAEAADILSFKDGAGVTNTITFTGVPFVGTIRGTFTTIESGSTVISVTAWYMSDPG